MRYRPFGRTGWPVSEIGYGMWGMGGWSGSDDAESVASLHRAVAGGCTFFDTAWAYGQGHSERLLGEVVRAHPDVPLVVASKIPPKNMAWPAPDGVDPDEAFPADHIRKWTERTLSNLGLDVLDVQQFHVWNDEWVGRGSWHEAIEALKDEGKIRFFGVSINDLQPSNAVRLIETGAVDTVQVIYNIFEQAPEDELFGACERNDVGVIARVPLDEGSLTGRLTADSTFPDGDFRNEYFSGERALDKVDERVRAILDDLGIEREDLAEVALRYVLSRPEVSTVIPGMRTVRNVERNMALGDGAGLPPEQVAALKSHRWDVAAA